MTDASDISPADIVCAREFTQSTGGRERIVLVRVLRPVPAGDHVACEYRIVGLGSHLDLADEQPFVARALGVDSMQALFLAFEGLRLALAPFERDLTWVQQTGYHGIPLMVSLSNDYGAEFRAKIEDLVQRETQDFLVKKYGTKIITAPRTT
jgi:hypothetical protein